MLLQVPLLESTFPGAITKTSLTTCQGLQAMNSITKLILLIESQVSQFDLRKYERSRKKASSNTMDSIAILSELQN